MNEENHPEKKIAIFKATLSLIAKNGFHESPTSKIAEEAGVGVGTIYRYFENKDDLINELFKYVETEMVDSILKDYNPDTPMHEQFINICKRYIQFAVENPRASSYFEQYIDSPYGSVMRKEKFYEQGETVSEQILPYPFYTLFNSAKKQGIIKDLPNSILFVLINGALTHFIRDIRIGFIDYNDEMVNRVVEACWGAVEI